MGLNIAITAGLGLTLMSAAAQTGSPAAVGRLRGHVESMGRPLSSADVRVRAGAREISHVRSNAVGDFFFTAVPEEFRITVSSPGYVTQQMSQDFRTDSTMTVFMLQPEGGVLRLSPVSGVANKRPWTYGALIQGGNGVTDNRDGFHFLMVGGRAGKVITGEVGTGLLKGNFEYGVEVFPFWQSYTPTFSKVSCNGVTASGTTACSAPYTAGGTYTGASITPIQLRWNFTHGERWMPWLQGGGGVIWTNHKYPAIGSTAPNLTDNGPNANTSVWNFTPQFGVGAHYMLQAGRYKGRSLDMGFNAVHISSASLGDKNPGVNASVQVSLGYSWWK